MSDATEKDATSAVTKREGERGPRHDPMAADLDRGTPIGCDVVLER